jgi:hypothetical protein
MALAWRLRTRRGFMKNEQSAVLPAKKTSKTTANKLPRLKMPQNRTLDLVFVWVN